MFDESYQMMYEYSGQWKGIGFKVRAGRNDTTFRREVTLPNGELLESHEIDVTNVLETLAQEGIIGMAADFMLDEIIEDLLEHSKGDDPTAPYMLFVKPGDQSVEKQL
ncbi:hypothetical protein HYU13_06305 [Candidatus Woesearchaeota archaeon]|nr:hypothetical protein [Candidatus Woesearchaeota archaeon]